MMTVFFIIILTFRYDFFSLVPIKNMQNYALSSKTAKKKEAKAFWQPKNLV